MCFLSLCYCIFFLLLITVLSLYKKPLSLSLPTVTQLWQNFNLLHRSILFLHFNLKIASSVVWAYCIFPHYFQKSLRPIHLEEPLSCFEKASVVYNLFTEYSKWGSYQILEENPPEKYFFIGGLSVFWILLFFPRCGKNL